MKKEVTMNTLDNPNLDGDFKALIKVQEVNVCILFNITKAILFAVVN